MNAVTIRFGLTEGVVRNITEFSKRLIPEAVFDYLVLLRRPHTST